MDLLIGNQFTSTIPIIIAGMTSLLALLITAVSLFCWIQQFRRKILGKNLEKDENIILDFVYHYKNFDPDSITRNVVLAERLAELATRMKGAEKLRLLAAYAMCGLIDEDYKSMQSLSRKKVISAVNRCRMLEAPIPRQAWNYLLSRNNKYMNWMILEYLIAIKSERSVAWILPYLNKPNSLSRGATIHILSCLASGDPQLVTEIFEISDSIELQDCCLRVMANYPDPKAQDLIIKYFNENLPKELQIIAFKALTSWPSDEIKDLLKHSYNSPIWQVRMEVAKVCRFFDNAWSHPILNQLSQDEIYFVRFHSIKSIYNGKAIDRMLANRILTDKNHPSYQIGHFFEETRRTPEVSNTDTAIDMDLGVENVS